MPHVARTMHLAVIMYMVSSQPSKLLQLTSYLYLSVGPWDITCGYVHWKDRLDPTVVTFDTKGKHPYLVVYMIHRIWRHVLMPYMPCMVVIHTIRTWCHIPMSVGPVDICMPIVTRKMGLSVLVGLYVQPAGSDKPKIVHVLSCYKHSSTAYAPLCWAGVVHHLSME